ncbi:MAG: IS21 family transposase [Deltaproteobacteria bacterium]|nr:IS21 family transposase [Deltaproteobacteria bacterium]
MITEAQRAEIRRLFYAEHWRIGTIARELSLHPDTVRAALETVRFNQRTLVRASALDPYTGFLRTTLEQYPKLRATRLHEMIVARGYQGSVGQTRRLVRRLRPRPVAEAYLRLRTLAGEEAQIDWGHFGKIVVGRAERPLSAFVMVLGWSRAIHVLFTLDQTMESFLRGHVEAFAYFGGSARTLLYDNLKTAVLARQGQVIEFHPRLLELAGHYHFLPRPCAVARGNEKGRVERQIRFLRDRFFAARHFRDVDDLNAQFLRWRTKWAHARPCPGDPEKTVAEALDEERPRLLPLPEHPFECQRVEAKASGKTPYLRFDRNDYSIPPEFVRKPLTLVAHHDTLRILDGATEVARHARCYDRGRTIEDPRHIEALVAFKRAARAPKGRDRLLRQLPHAEAFFQRMLEHEVPLAQATAQITRLLSDYGASATDAALAHALERETVSLSSLALWLEQQRRKHHALPRVPIELPDRPGVRQLTVPPHNLETYDALSKPEDHDAATRIEEDGDDD